MSETGFGELDLSDIADKSKEKPLSEVKVDQIIKNLFPIRHPTQSTDRALDIFLKIDESKTSEEKEKQIEKKLNSITTEDFLPILQAGIEDLKTIPSKTDNEYQKFYVDHAIKSLLKTQGNLEQYTMGNVDYIPASDRSIIKSLIMNHLTTLLNRVSYQKTVDELGPDENTKNSLDYKVMSRFLADFDVLFPDKNSLSALAAAEARKAAREREPKNIKLESALRELRDKFFEPDSPDDDLERILYLSDRLFNDDGKIFDFNYFKPIIEAGLESTPDKDRDKKKDLQTAKNALDAILNGDATQDTKTNLYGYIGNLIRQLDKGEIHFGDHDQTAAELNIIFEYYKDRISSLTVPQPKSA